MPVAEIMRLTDGHVAIEALGRQETFKAALRVLRPGGTLSSLGVNSSDLRIPIDLFLADLGDHKVITTLCPGGKECMRRLMDTIASGRLDTRPLDALSAKAYFLTFSPAFSIAPPVFSIFSPVSFFTPRHVSPQAPRADAKDRMNSEIINRRIITDLFEMCECALTALLTGCAQSASGRAIRQTHT